MISVLLESRSVCAFSRLTKSVYSLELPIITTINHKQSRYPISFSAGKGTQTACPSPHRR